MSENVKNNVNFSVIRRIMQTEFPTSMLELAENATLLAYWLGLAGVIGVSWKVGIPTVPAEQGFINMLFIVKPPVRLAMVTATPSQYSVVIYPGGAYTVEDITQRVIRVSNN